MIAEFKNDPEILADFVLESSEHLLQIEEHVLLLEKDPLLFPLLHSIFRGFHSIKGLAGFLELADVQSVAHETETLLDHARNSKLEITPVLIDLVLDVSEYLREEIRIVQTRLDRTFVASDHSNLDLLERLALAIRSVAEKPCEVRPADSAMECGGAALGSIPQPDFFEADPLIFTAGLSAVDGTLPSPPSTVHSQSSTTIRDALRSDPQPPAQAAPGTALHATIRVDTARLDRLIDMVGEMVIAQSMLGAASLQGAERSGGEIAQLARITSEIQRCALSMRMMPIGPLFQKNAKMVRDLARRTGKHLTLHLSGESTELDKAIAEALADPLLHMIRNALDHGIELPEERVRQGKPATATLRISAEHRAGQVVIAIADDGRGLDAEKIRAKALDKGLIEENALLSAGEIFELIFAPGFSTAEKITDLSGRGVGMDVVRKHVEALRGRIEISSEPGKGTTFSIYLPLTLAIIEGLVVVISDHQYVIPLLSIREMFRPVAGQIVSVHGNEEMILVRDRLLPVLRLHSRLNIEPRKKDIRDDLLVICEVSGRLFCLVVDGLIGRQEIVIKGLDEVFRGIKAISGSTILSDGRVGLIIDVAGLLLSTQSLPEVSAA